jgi:hypothetical protein
LLAEGEEDDLLKPKNHIEDPLAGVLDLGSESSEEEKPRPFINTGHSGGKPFMMKKQESHVTSNGQRSSSI